MIRRFAYRALGHLPVRAKLLLNKLVNDTFQIGLVGVVYDSDGRVLVLSHTYRPAIPHGLPSGWLRRGETVAGGLEREIREETGFEVTFDRILEIEPSESASRLDIWLQFTFVGGEFRPSAEVSAGRFYDFEELPPMLDAQERFLRALSRGRESSQK